MAQAGTLRARQNGLTAAFVKSAAPGKYHDAKGLGLLLVVKDNGSRFWVQRITIRGKRREIGLGSPPVVTLADAREQAMENKRLIRAGGDPLAEKRKAKGILTFAEAARKTHVEVAPTLKNPKDAAAFLTTLETYMFPYVGNVPLPDVTSGDVRRAILAARDKAPGVAKKLIYRTSRVFKWGIAENMCTGNPATAGGLALPRHDGQVRHRKSLPYGDVADCIDVVRASGAGIATKLALEFLILTATRSGETREARWDEFDLDDAAKPTKGTWLIPGSRTKTKRPHRVPLSDRALQILREARALSDGSGLVFPGTRKDRPLSDMTLSKLVKELGFDVDVHGFRTSFRTWTQDETHFPRELAEAALAHKVGDAAEQAYARSDMFEKRRRMMQAWADYLAGREAKVVAMRRSKS